MASSSTGNNNRSTSNFAHASARALPIHLGNAQCTRNDKLNSSASGAVVQAKRRGRAPGASYAQSAANASTTESLGLQAPPRTPRSTAASTNPNSAEPRCVLQPPLLPDKRRSMAFDASTCAATAGSFTRGTSCVANDSKAPAARSPLAPWASEGAASHRSNARHRTLFKRSRARRVVVANCRGLSLHKMLAASAMALLTDPNGKSVCERRGDSLAIRTKFEQWNAARLSSEAPLSATPGAGVLKDSRPTAARYLPAASAERCKATCTVEASHKPSKHNVLSNRHAKLRNCKPPPVSAA
mmetsp:Transcript_44054/g.121945  ORF Transcript_44054/g.121945 Transcript_44054/m.121945 type:complete len:299 (+) Transcript_44054:1122-2018(+)